VSCTQEKTLYTKPVYSRGRLGLRRAIVLREDGCKEFSNLAGVQEIRFSKANIRETFGEVLATIKRECGM